MKNRVKIEESNFYVDEENRIVVCVLKCNMQLDKHPVSELIFTSRDLKNYPNLSWHGEFTVRAKARCSNLDTFDVNTGKKIAESRAKAKMFKIAGRFYRSCMKVMEKAAGECYRSAINCEKALSMESNHVCELISRT